VKYEEFKDISYRKLAGLTGDSRSTWWTWLNSPNQSPNMIAIETLLVALKDDAVKNGRGLKLTRSQLYDFLLRRRNEALSGSRQSTAA
jgi:hypothetical protein